MTGVQTFWLERVPFVAVGLRRYSGSYADGDYHSALRYTGVINATYREESGSGARPGWGYLEPQPKTAYDDPQWPQVCDQHPGCDYVFKPEDHWQDWQEQVYDRSTGGRRVLHQNAPAHELGLPSAEPGASWNAWWMPSSWANADGMYLMVRLPDGHDWAVDSRASNCTLPDDNEHKCWVRHGDPRECHVTVDKNGLTCSAGAGSIASPKWHGFLRNGVLVE